MIQLCPKCHGEGTVPIPPFIGAVEYYIDSITGVYKCKMCGGRGYVEC